MKPRLQTVVTRPPLLLPDQLVVLDTPHYGQRVFRVGKANGSRVVLDILSEYEHKKIAIEGWAKLSEQRHVAEVTACVERGMEETTRAAAFARQSWFRRLLARRGGGG